MSIKSMKYIFILIFVVFLNNNFCSAMSINLYSAEDTINTISKISFTISSSGWRTFEDLLTNSNYRIIIDSSCKVELTWPGKCPNKDLMACSYFGKISRKEFEKLKKIILVKNLLELKNVYDTEFSDNGVEIYKIIFNDNEEKIILDSDYHIKSLNRLRYMIIKLKKNIVWKPDIN